MVRKFAVEIPYDTLSDLCRRWQVAELALFGSVVRDDFSAGSDIDVLVSFLPEARWTILDEIRMEEEVSAVFGRRVELVPRRAVEQSQNPIRQKAILESAVSIYVAR